MAKKLPLFFQRNSSLNHVRIIKLTVISIFSLLAIACSSIATNGGSHTISPDRTNPGEGVTVHILPLNPSLALGGRLQFTAAVTNTNNSAVVWSVSAGTITSDGFYSAPTDPKIGTVTVSVTSVPHPAVHASSTVSLTNSTLTVTNSSLPSGLVGTPYSEQLTADGGTLPYRWNLVSGSLPAGLQLISSSGTIQGTPTASGSSALTFEVKDAAAHTAQRSVAVSVSKLASNCGPPTYNCSRADSAFAPIPRVMPNWGGFTGTNTAVNDPDFHNPIVRATDAKTVGAGDNFCTGLGGSGDVPQVWNADSTILLVCDQQGFYFPIGFDPVNFKSLGPLYGTSPTVFKSGGGVFSHSDPNRFYALISGQIQIIDYTDRTTRPTPQLLYDFANCGIGTIGWQSNGGSDLTDTIFSAGFSHEDIQGTGYFVAVYNSSTHVCFNLNTSTGVVTQYPGAKVVGKTNFPDRFYVHNVKMKGGTTLVVSPQSCIGADCGPHPYAWVIGTTQMYGLGSGRGGGHWAVGCGKWLNQPGDFQDYEVIRDFLSPTLWSPIWSVSSSECGAAPRMSCFEPFDSHPAWLGDCSDTGPVCMATISPDNVVQYPYQNEIVCFTTDGSNRRIRFAHTYSSIASGFFDANYSIGSPSQDGKFYAWTTQAGGQFGCRDGTFACSLHDRRADVLIVKLQ